jgi:hypothetical protein
MLENQQSLCFPTRRGGVVFKAMLLSSATGALIYADMMIENALQTAVTVMLSWMLNGE